MATWTNVELDRIGNAEELQIDSLRGDGTLRKPVTIWVVRVGNDLYVRSYLGGARRAGYHPQAGGEISANKGRIGTRIRRNTFRTGLPSPSPWCACRPATPPIRSARCS